MYSNFFKQLKTKKMKTSDFTATLMVAQTKEEAFESINNVSKWWSEDMEGSIDARQDRQCTRHMQLD